MKVENLMIFCFVLLSVGIHSGKPERRSPLSGAQLTTHSDISSKVRQTIQNQKKLICFLRQCSISKRAALEKSYKQFVVGLLRVFEVHETWKSPASNRKFFTSSKVVKFFIFEFRACRKMYVIAGKSGVI